MKRKTKSLGGVVFLIIGVALAGSLISSCGKSENLSLGERVHRRHQRALQYYEEGDYARCLEEINAVLNLDPNYSPAQDLLSEAKEKFHFKSGMGRSEEVKKLFREALRLAEEPGKLKSAILKCKEALKHEPDYGLARIKLKKWIERLEEQIGEHYQSGSRHFKYGNYGRAIEEWNIVIHLTLEKSDPLYIKAEEGIGLAREKLRE